MQKTLPLFTWPSSSQTKLANPSVDLKRSLLIYSGIFLFLILSYGVGLTGWAKENQVRIIGWDTLLLGAFGYLALFLQHKAGFAQLWDRQVHLHNRFGLPFLIGLFFGLLDLIVIELIVSHPPHDSLPPYTQPFPYSLLLYPAGAVYVELLYRLLPLTLVGLIGNRLHKGKFQHLFFWVFATILSLVEPIMQLPGGSLWLIAYSFISGFAFNFLQAIYLKNAGFLAALTIRLGHYLVWHILLGMYIQFVLL